MLARRLIDFLACAAMAISCAGVVHAQGGTGLPGIPRATALVPMELAAPASQAGTVAAPVLPAKTEPPLPDMGRVNYHRQRRWLENIVLKGTIVFVVIT